MSTSPADEARRIRACLAACADLTTEALENGSLSRMIGALAVVNANLSSALELVRDHCEGQAIVPTVGFLPAVSTALEWNRKANEES